MSGAERIKEKILEDAQTQAKANIEKAESEATRIIRLANEEAKKKQDEIIGRAIKEAENKRSRLISVAELEGRKQRLSAKQEMIEKVFVKALEKLNKLPAKEYENILTGMIVASVKSGDEEIILCERDKKRISSKFINNINHTLKNKGIKGKVKLSNNTRNISGGFILKKGNIEINSSFETIIEMMRDDLEKLIVTELF